MFLAGLGQGIAAGAAAVGQGVAGAAQAIGPAVAKGATAVGQGVAKGATAVGEGALDVVGGLGQNLQAVPGRAAHLFRGVMDFSPTALGPYESMTSGVADTFGGLARTPGNVMPGVAPQAAQVGPGAANVPRVVSHAQPAQMASPGFTVDPSAPYVHMQPPMGPVESPFTMTPLQHYAPEGVYGPDIPPGSDSPMRYVGRWFDIVGEDGRVDPKKLIQKFGSATRGAGSGMVAGGDRRSAGPAMMNTGGPAPQWPGPLFPPGYFR